MTIRSQVLLLGALLIAIAGYFGPWVWHPAVVFRYSADDLSEFVKFMPAVRTGQLPVVREWFFIPIWLGALGLALWSGEQVRSRWIRLLIGWALVYAAIWPMPRYPFILDAYQSPEYALSFWLSVVAALLCALALTFGARISMRARSWLWVALGLLGATVAPLPFGQVKPALDALHGWTMSLGWGIVATVSGFVGVAAIGAWQARRQEDKTHR